MPWVSAMWCVRCSSVAASVDAGSCWCKGVGQCGGGQCDPVWAVEVFVLGEGLAESPFGGVKVAEHSVADALPVCDGAAVVHRGEYEVACSQRGDQLQDDRGEVGAVADLDDPAQPGHVPGPQGGAVVRAIGRW